MFVLPMNSNHKGAIAESMIQAAAVELGVEVFTPVSGHARADLIFVIGSQVLRVQVKWGRLDPAGDVVIVHVGGSRPTPAGYVSSSYAEDKVDLLAVYCAELKRSFLMPVSLFAGMKGIHLRLTPARNNQQSCTNLADDYDFTGAVAQLARAFGWQPKGRGFESLQLHSPATADSPPQTIESDEAYRTWGRLIDRVSAGEEIIVTRRGRPRIRLSPV
jgi:prevent-host-death family protein